MAVYYNENDPKAAEWLRELIAADLIAGGEVDERSIEDVRPKDLAGFRQAHFFAGIGGWSYALRLAGWPDDRPVWTGSCPCQPFSQAGAGKGTDDPRHLWPIWRWLVDQRRPAIVFGEQVASKDGRAWLAGVRADLEAMGYTAGAADLCAAGIGAPHIRQRLYWVADATNGNGRGRESGKETGTGTHSLGRRRPSGGGKGGRGAVSSTQGKAPMRPVGDGAIPAGPVGGLGQPDSGGRTQGQQAAETTRHGGSVEPAGGNGRLCDPDKPRSQGRRILSERTGERAAWAASLGNWVPCADGKARRIEPGLEPLVNGLPDRVGLLRGYGNAIVPELAATFIEAVMSES